MGLRLLIEGKRWEVCAEAVNGEDALVKIQSLRPDVVILDLSMPKLNGYDIAPKIRTISPVTKIVFFTMHDVPATAREIGADAFVTKSQGGRELIRTIERMMQSGLDAPQPVS